MRPFLQLGDESGMGGSNPGLEAEIQKRKHWNEKIKYERDEKEQWRLRRPRKPKTESINSDERYQSYSLKIKFIRTPQTSTMSPSLRRVGPGIGVPFTVGVLSPGPI